MRGDSKISVVSLLRRNYIERTSLEGEEKVILCKSSWRYVEVNCHPCRISTPSILLTGHQSYTNNIAEHGVKL